MTTTSVYLRALALADIGVLITAVFRYKTYKIFLDDVQEMDSAFHFDAYAEVYLEPLHWTALGSSSFSTLNRKIFGSQISICFKKKVHQYYCISLHS
jgi:hypothetical protein